METRWLSPACAVFLGRQKSRGLIHLSLRRPPLFAKSTDAPRRTYLAREDGRRRRGGDAADVGGGGEEGGGHRARGRVRGRTPGGQRVRRARPDPVSRSRARVSLAPTLRRRSRSPAGAGTIDRPGSRRTARAWRARRALRASSFAPFDPPPERLPPRRARRVAHAPTSRSAD